MNQDTLRLRKLTAADSMEAAEVALTDIVKQALESATVDVRRQGDLVAEERIADAIASEILNHQTIAAEQIIPAELLDDLPVAPVSWTKGQLLNVRNRGEFYVVTLLGEEDDPPLKPAPNGALRFTNTALCQDFVSKWYATEHHDPRAR
jgi:hypothetical protein